ncbi:MAG TPA: hypothetical protein VGX03_20950 [Candidatus Binatia bacterium]|jgi:hypothetical protein|nr:hypothetical protein [Candidatus Binatia bacterium]
MAQTAAPIEAVIISGPRRGEIIQLPDTALAEVSGEDIGMLNEALDGLLTAIAGVSTEVRATIEMLREREETT